MKINYSSAEGKFWIEGDDGSQYFDSVLDAKDAARQLEIEMSVKAERYRIVAWLRKMDDYSHDAVRADQIEAGEHLK